MRNIITVRKVFLVLFLLLILLPVKSQAQVTNAGFVPGNIWYSKDPFEEGDKIKIYTLIFNPDERELRGSVIFFDKNTFLGKKEFTAPIKGVKDVAIDWTVNVGEHNIFAKIENARFILPNGKYEEVYLAGNETSKSSRTVSKKIVAKPSDTISPLTLDLAVNIGEVVENAGSVALDSVKNNIPDVISKPIVLAINTVEAVRQNLGTASEKKREEVRAQLKASDTNGAQVSVGSTKDTSAQTVTNKFVKPFKYTELFALAVLGTTFNNKFIFYTALILIIFFLLRYVVKRVR